MTTIPFTKMHGLGNDFVLIDYLKTPNTPKITPEIAARIGDRHFGIGCDQILLLKTSEKADARMEILNSDGSKAEMCGNGIRAMARYLFTYGPKKGQNEFSIETLTGVKTIEREDELYRVNMGPPHAFARKPEEIEIESLSLQNTRIRFFEVNMGNPHAVVFMDSPDQYNPALTGPLIENHPRFPKKTNVEFVYIRDKETLDTQVWERGAGITLACGSGACAVAVAAISTQEVEENVEVQLPGGTLTILWSGEKDADVTLEGPATEVFQGEFPV